MFICSFTCSVCLLHEHVPSVRPGTMSCCARLVPHARVSAWLVLCSVKVCGELSRLPAGKGNVASSSTPCALSPLRDVACRERQIPEGANRNVRSLSLHMQQGAAHYRVWTTRMANWCAHGIWFVFVQVCVALSET